MMEKGNVVPAKFSSYQRSVIVILALLQFTVILDFMIIAPIGYILTKDLGITTGEFGVVVSAYIFSAATAGIISAGFVDRFDRKKVLLFFFTGFILGTLCCSLSGSYNTLLASRIFTGVFGGVTSSMTITIISDLFEPSQRGRAMSTVQLAFAASQILGIPAGIVVADKFGWHHTFFFIVVLSILILFMIRFKLKPVNSHLNTGTDKNPFLHLWHTISNKKHLTGFSATIVLGMGMMMQPFVSIFLIHNVKVTTANVPLIFMVTGGAAFFVMPLVGRLSDTFDKYRIFLIGSLATLVIVPVYTNLPVVPLWVVLILNVTMFAVIMSRMGPYQALNSMIPLPADRGAYMGISSSLQQMAGGLGIIIAGGIVSQTDTGSALQNFDMVGYVVMALTVIGMYLAYRVNEAVKK